MWITKKMWITQNVDNVDNYVDNVWITFFRVWILWITLSTISTLINTGLEGHFKKLSTRYPHDIHNEKLVIHRVWITWQKVIHTDYVNH